MSPMQPFFVTRPLKASALSSPVGSGKSYAAAQFLARADQSRRNWVYVAPTIALVEQVTADLRKAAGMTGNITRNVSLIHSENRHVQHEDDETDASEAALSTRAAALQALNRAEEADGVVVVLTTGTLLSVMSSVTHPERFGLILDEAFKPLRVDGWALGDSVSKVVDNWRYFREVFDIDVTDGHRLVPAAGQQETVEAIAAGRFRTTGAKYAGLQKIAELVANKATRCELVKSEQMTALLRGEEPVIRKSTGKDKDKDAAVMLTYAGYVSPEPFATFREALFLSALFEDTILYHLWTRALGVTFEEHKDFPKSLQVDTHTKQGPFLSVGHMLNGSNTASIENLSRDATTGLRGAVNGRRVLDRLVSEAGRYFMGKGGFLLQVNAKKGYGSGDSAKLPIPANARLIPAFAYGSNAWQDTDHVAALCVINPTPIELAWVMERTGMTGSEVARSYRIHSTYQALGRCSIRRRDEGRKELPKTLLCVGKDEAEFIHRLFPGSTNLGQVTDLPCLRGLEKANTAPKVKAQTMSEELSAVIKRHLKGIDLSTVRLSSEEVKSQLLAGSTSPSGSCTPNPSKSLRRDECASWATVHRNTWSAAFELACNGSSWRRAGRWLERVTWAGLVEQAGLPVEDAAGA